jgi:hypothetical protein
MGLGPSKPTPAPTPTLPAVGAPVPSPPALTPVSATVNAEGDAKNLKGKSVTVTKLQRSRRRSHRSRKHRSRKNR